MTRRLAGCLLASALAMRSLLPGGRNAGAFHENVVQADFRLPAARD